jgi:hypothetical protein
MRRYRALAAKIAATLDLERPDLVEHELIRAARLDSAELLRRVERAETLRLLRGVRL